MATSEISRRTFVTRGGTALAGAMLLNTNLGRRAFGAGGKEKAVPWLDRRADNPVPEVIANQPDWEELDSWITPEDKFFSVAHYDRPAIDADTWQLEVSGQVRQRLALSLDELMARPRRELTFTLECSGNNGLPFFNAGIGNARWAGTSLASLLEEAGIRDEGIEVVFVGRDAGEETVREKTFVQNFARSMSVKDAMHPDNLLCYEMNGDTLSPAHGYPLRLIAPGWYGIANVKWLERIEIWDTRLQNRFMARDYVTLRREGTAESPEWVESSVGRMLLKSAPGRVIRGPDAHRIEGAAWGAPIAKVEVSIDGGPWRTARLERGRDSRYAWVFWSLDWPEPAAGEHTVTARAVDTAGNVQPPPDAPHLANKVTYWESNGQITRRVRIG